MYGERYRQIQALQLVCIAAYPYTGKEKLLQYYCYGEINNNAEATIGPKLVIKNVNINRTRVKLQIWELSANRHMFSIKKQYLRDSDAIIMVFDKTSRRTFENIQPLLNKINYSQDIPLILIGNKSDMREDYLVSSDEAQAYAQQLNAEYFECSARTGENVEQAFNAAAHSGWYMAGAQRKELEHNLATLDPVEPFSALKNMPSMHSSLLIDVENSLDKCNFISAPKDHQGVLPSQTRATLWQQLSFTTLLVPPHHHLMVPPCHHPNEATFLP